MNRERILKSTSVWLLTGIVFLSLQLKSQEGYRVNLKVTGNADSILLITSYYGSKIKITDTAIRQPDGSFLMEGKNHLPGGIYMAVTPSKSKLFEFVVGEQQNFTLQTDTADYAKSMVVEGSEENRVFYEYLLYNESIYQKNKDLSEDLKHETDSLIIKKLRSEMDSLNTRSIDYKLTIIDQYPDLFVSRLFNAMREIEIPDSITSGADSSAAFKYYKSHYWDYFDLSDSTLLRTPVIANKLNQYFEQVVFFHPDSVVSAIDLLIAKARPNYEMVSFLVWHFMSEYQNPKYMGFDKIFVHLVDSYFTKEPIQNTTPSVMEMLTKRANTVRPLLLGEPAPNMILIDTTEKLTSLYSLKAKYTLVLFWDYDCGICKREITELKKLYAENQLGMEVFAVSVNGDLAKWKKAINDHQMPWINVNGTRSATPDFHDLYDIHGTPVLYLLDSDKKIVAKRIGAEQIPDLIRSLE